MGQQKTQTRINVFPALFGACVLIGWVLYPPIHSNINTRYREVQRCLLWPKQKLTTPLHTVVQPKSLKALNDEIQQERCVRQQHRTESSKAPDDGISTRRYVCQSLVGTTTTVYIA